MAVDTPVRAVVVVMLLLSVCLGMVVGGVSVQECEVDVVVVAGGEQLTFTKDRSNTDRSQMTLYVKVEDGFEGFTVSVEGTDGIGYSAWFPTDEECFRDKHSWHQLQTFAQIKKTGTTIMFGFETRYCRKECERVPAPQSLQQHSVEVHGASRWSKYYPQGQCEVAPPLGMTFHGKHLTCSKRPTSMSTLTIIVIVMAALVGVPMLLLLAVYLRRKLIKERSAPSGTHTEGHSAKERRSTFLEGLEKATGQPHIHLF